MLALENGYEIIDELVSPDQVNAIKKDIQAIKLPENTGGLRNADKVFSSVKKLAQSKRLISLANSYLPGNAQLVRAILFNKTEKSNWLVSWHQDRTVCVSAPFEKENWQPWSTKAGIHHVQPPIEVLEQMIAVRIHLDAANLDNGCLKVLPNSHKFGIMDNTAIQKYVKSHDPVICETSAGAALVMRPHLLHSSSKASSPSQRRVLHFEYSSFDLPQGITWA